MMHQNRFVFRQNHCPVLQYSCKKHVNRDLTAGIATLGTCKYHDNLMACPLVTGLYMDSLLHYWEIELEQT